MRRRQRIVCTTIRKRRRAVEERDALINFIILKTEGIELKWIQFFSCISNLTAEQVTLKLFHNIGPC